MTTLQPVSARLQDRALLLTASNLPAGIAQITTDYAAITGLIATPAAIASCLQLRRHDPTLIVGQETDAARAHWASAETPHLLGRGTGLFMPTLRERVAAHAGVDVILSPTGTVRAGDEAALWAVIAATNDVDDARLVCSLPLEAGWLTEMHRDTLMTAIGASRSVVALSVVGQGDPFDDWAVADGLIAVAEQHGSKVVLHHTDTTALQFVARGGLGAIIGCTTSQRHVVPPLARPRTRVRSRTRRTAVFVPGIAEFRAISTLEEWFGADAPKCQEPGCCGRKLTDFDAADKDDLRVLAAHNVRGLLDVFSDLVSHTDRSQWLSDHRARITMAYQQLRTDTKIADIVPFRAAQGWLSRTA